MCAKANMLYFLWGKWQTTLKLLLVREGEQLFLLTHFSSYCLHYLNAWNRLHGDGCLKKMVSAHCTVQCINHSLKLKKLVSVTVHLPLYSTVKYSLKSCSPSRTNNSLRVVCHFPHRKYSMLALAHITTDVFSSGSFIPHAHFEIILVMVSYYGYEIWRHK